MKLFRFIWKSVILAGVFGIGFVIGREHSFEEEEAWELENEKKRQKEKENGSDDDEEGPCSSCPSAESKKAKAVENPADNEVVFEYEDPEANKVSLVGTFNNWNKDSDPMEKIDNVWKRTVMLPQGTHEYQFVINDTEWLSDPATENKVPNKYKGQNSVITIQ